MEDYCGFCGGPKPKPWTRFCQTQCQRDQNQLDFLLRKKEKLQDESLKNITRTTDKAIDKLKT